MRARPQLSGAARVALVATLVGAAAAVTVWARSDSHGRPGLTVAQVAALDAPRQAALLQPLRDLAAAVDRVGRGVAWRPDYSGVALDAPDETVRLYSVTARGGAGVLAEAERDEPSLHWSAVRVLPARYAIARLDGAAEILGADPDVARVAVPANGSGLDVTVSSAAGRSALHRLHVGVTIRSHVDGFDVTKSWADVKWHDRPDFIGGDVLTADGRTYCTAGLPAIRRSDGRPVMVTAAHCFAAGRRVYTGGGRTGAGGDGRTGEYVGTAGAPVRRWDSSPLVGSTHAGDVSDSAGWKPLTSVGYSYEGDFVCHAGAASFFLGHPTPCGIEVTDGDIWFRIGGAMARGVEGVDVRHGWGSHNGDSGGTVFAVQPGGARQARGMVSSGGLDGTSDQKRVDWTEAPDVLRALGLRLDPRH